MQSNVLNDLAEAKRRRTEKKWYCSWLHFCFDADGFLCRSRPRKNRSLQKLYKKQLAGLVRLQKPSKAEAAHRFVVFAS
jgi:hypothetical protein